MTPLVLIRGVFCPSSPSPKCVCWNAHALGSVVSLSVRTLYVNESLDLELRQAMVHIGVFLVLAVFV